MSLFKKLYLCLVFIVLTACGGSGSEDTTSVNQELYEYLQDWYLWESDLPSNYKPSANKDIYETFEDLRDRRDRFSFIFTEQEFEDYQASIVFGYGFSFLVNEDQNGLVIRYVYDEGSAAQSGLRRGDTITAVDEKSIRTIITEINLGRTTFAKEFGPNEEGFTIPVTVEKPNGEEFTTDISKGRIEANTVMATQVKQLQIDNRTQTVGYLVFDSFDEKSSQELNDSIDELLIQDVEQLILDLRYNSGGLVRVANQLSSQMVSNARVDGKVFNKTTHNDKQSVHDETTYFNIGEGIERLNLDSLIVLTSPRTCSASELVINSLAPFVDVVVIGEKTCGKPTGMYPTPVGDYVVVAINFTSVNAAGFGEYFNGLPVDCAVADKITGDWGVETDPLLKEGLYYLQNRQCSNRVSAAQQQTKQVKTPKVTVDFTQGPIKVKNLL